MNHENQTRTAVMPELERAAGIRLTPDLYTAARSRGLGLSELLEELDPSQPGSSLDAFERQLALAGIKIAGGQADVIDRFFASTENAVLFPEFVSRAVRAGMQEFGKLDRIVATRTRIEDDTYKTIYMDDSVLSSEKLQLARVGEGAQLPKIEISTATHTLSIYKFGRYLEASYEAIRRKKASVVSVFLRAVGVQIQKDKFATAVDVLINGDGNDNAAPVLEVATPGTLDFADLVAFALAFDPYDLNVMIANAGTAKRLLTLEEFKDPAVSLSFLREGDPVTPFGAQLVVSDAVGDNLIVGLDRRFALEEVYETGVITESDRLIRQQIEGTAISEVAGFGKVINSATRVLSIGTAE